MNAERIPNRMVSAFVLILVWALSACAPQAAPTWFRPPGGLPSPTALPLGGVQPTPGVIVLPVETLALPPTEILPAPPCTDSLIYIDDITFEDDTVVLPGQAIDKQWLAQNSGTCDWDARYRLQNVNGETLGAPIEIPLYPARAGAQFILRIIFSAPVTAGTYHSEWQAVNPDGVAFGNPIYIQIVVP